MILICITAYLLVGFVIASLIYSLSYYEPDLSFIQTMLFYPILAFVWLVVAVIEWISDKFWDYKDWLRKGKGNNSGTGDLW